MTLPRFYKWLLPVCLAACVSSLAQGQAVTVSPTTLSFGNQVQNTPSAVKQVTLKNGQTTAITITSISPSLSDYSQTNNCPVSPATLGAGKSCTVSVTFTPAALGSRAATLTVKDTGKNSSQTVALSGTGIAAVTATPTSISFGNEVIGVKSAASSVTVKNNQTVALTITKISATLSDYTNTTTCPLSPKTLAAGGTCTVQVFFTPTVAGVRNDTLTISDNAAVSPTISLTGTGIVAVTVNPASLTFATQALGTKSAAQTVTLTNNQSTTLKVTSITTTGDYSVTSTCPKSPLTLAAGASCTASVIFKPTAQGTRTGTLSFNDNAKTTPQTAPLTGTGGPPNLVSIAVTPANASIIAGTTQQFTATGTYSDGSTQNLTSSATWSSSTLGVATISSAGLASGLTKGSTTISATSGTIAGSTTLTVGAPALVSIAVSPANPSIAKGTTLALKATGTYSDGSTQDITSTAAWTTANSQIATVSAQGAATGASVGSTNVTATSSAISGSTLLTVTPATLVSIAVTPAIPSIPQGATQQFTATGTFTDNTTQDVTATVQWSSSSQSTATISNSANSQGLATGVSTGTANITAISGSINGSTVLTVTQAALVSIAVTPQDPTISLGTTQQFTASGSYTDGSTKDLTASATWTSDNLSVATINLSGLAASAAIGSANITATSGLIAGSTSLTVGTAKLVSIALNPASASVPVGVPQQFTATGTYTDGTTQDLTTVGHWTSSAASVATVSNAAGSQGLATTLGTGDTRIGLSSDTVSASATLSVVPAALVSIAIGPANANIALGTNQQFTATGTYTDSTTQDLTSTVTWASSDASVAVISNASGTAGLASSSGIGTANISATLGQVSSSTSLTVGTAAIVSIAVSPSNASIPLGTTQQFTATGTYTDGSTQDLTSSVNWSASPTNVVSIGADGVALGVAMGSATLTATSGGVQGSAGVSVGPPVLVSLAVSPDSGSIAAGNTEQFSAIGTYSDGSSQNLTTSVAWRSSLPGVATISGAGLANGVAQGTTSITATLGTIVASATLSVTPPVLTSISVSPSSASIANGTTQQFTATGTYSDGSTQDLTGSADWSSSLPGIAIIDSTGLATGKGMGTATISATSGPITGSAALQVGQPKLLSIAVAPANASLALGTSQAFKATGTYTDGSTQDITATVAWGTGDSTIATIDANGSATSVAVGNTTVSATLGSIAGSTQLTITPAALVSIAVTPAIPSIPSGTTLQFTATGTFTDGSTQDVTKTVQWTSDSPSVATISNADKQIGLATSVNAGTATITATSGSITGNTTLTVTPAALASIAVTPATPSIALGTTQQFTAIGTFTDGTMQDLTATATWTLDDTTIASISSGGLTTTIKVGASNVNATSGTIVGSTLMTVTEAQIVSLAINPDTAAVPQGSTQQFMATATFTDGTTQDVTQSAHWSSTDASIATISNAAGTQGLATTLASGSTTIGVASGSASASAFLTVNPADLVSIAIAPQSPILALGTSQQFAATGSYTDGSTKDITAIVTWSSSSAAVIVISNAVGSNGLAASAGVGTATITATNGNITSSTLATVGQATITSVAVTPAGTSIAQGYTLQFTATATFSDGSSQDITQSAAWTSSSPSVANISSTGLATGLLSGPTTISATSQNISGSTSLIVTVPVPVSLSVAPLNPSIYTGAIQQFTATVVYSDGSWQDVTSSASWTSTATSIATIGSTGLATASNAGLTTIQAAWGTGLVASTSLNVSAPSITITPASASISISATQQFSATVSGSSNQSVTWAVDGITGGNSSVGTISASGLYNGSNMIGYHSITATSQANSGSSGNASLTVGSLTPVLNTFFGMHLHYATSAVPSSMVAAGRIWDSNAAQWPNLNPTATGPFAWANLDAVLASYKAAGINDILYTLWRVPKWASSVPNDASCDYASLGTNYTGACDLPFDLATDGTGTNLTWRTWVQNIAQHVNDSVYLQTHAKISYWEPCNECYRSPTLDKGYGLGGASVAYKGTYAQLVRMMQDARCIIIGKTDDPITALNTSCGAAGYPVIGIDPTAKMVMPSTSPLKVGGNPSYPTVTQNLLYCTCTGNSCSASSTGCTTGNAGSNAVDILSVHIYPNNYKPEDIPGQVSAVRAVLQPQDLAKPLWDDEGGWGQNTTATQLAGANPDLEAAWIARFHIMNWASGLGRAYWYEWDNAAYGTLWSPTSIQGCTTPFTGGGFICSGGIAYQQVHDWMVGSTLTNCSSVGTSWTCNLVRSNGSAAQILWDTSQTCSNGTCGTIQYSVGSQFNMYEDLTGATHSISGSVPVGIKLILVFTQAGS